MSRKPGRMASVLGESMWFQRGTVEQRRNLVEAVQKARRHCAVRVARVKAHPDLAARLVADLGYARFDQWNGFVPSSVGDNDQPVYSPRREAIMAVLREVANRESEVA